MLAEKDQASFALATHELNALGEGSAVSSLTVPTTPPVPTVLWSVPLGPHFFPTSTTPTAMNGMSANPECRSTSSWLRS